MGQTANHRIEYPEQGDNVDVAGDAKKLADSVEAALDALSVGLVGRAVPTGTIVAFGGSTAPAGWHLCDGTAHNSPALQAVIGSPNTPDLRSRFIMGAGSGTALKSTGGAATVTLTAAQSGMPSHAHTASAGTESANHTHGGATASMNRNAAHAHGMDAVGDHGHGAWTDGGTGHNHGSAYANNWQGSGQSQNPAGDDYMPIGQNAPGHRTTDGGHHTHGVGIGGAGAHAHGIHATDTNHEHGFTTGGVSANHSHAITVAAAAAANASAPHENLPPYYALTYIVKV